MIATAGPKRSGSALGVPVPNNTTLVSRVTTRSGGRIRAGRPGSCAAAEAVTSTVKSRVFMRLSLRLLLQKLRDGGSKVRGGAAQRIDFGTQSDGAGKVPSLYRIELLLG